MYSKCTIFYYLNHSITNECECLFAKQQQQQQQQASIRLFSFHCFLCVCCVLFTNVVLAATAAASIYIILLFYSFIQFRASQLFNRSIIYVTCLFCLTVTPAPVTAQRRKVIIISTTVRLERSKMQREMM